jgi:photosystem II stability/assembly factor-like uncharacterized protein
VPLAVLLAAIAASAPVAARAATPPIRHIWVIDLENRTWNNNFAHAGANFPYERQAVPALGTVVENYFGIGHNSLDNYIAQISGQAPNPDSQGDCLAPADWYPPDSPLDVNGQVVGQGCVLPKAAKTIANQLQAQHMTWKGYQEDMGKDLMSDRRSSCATSSNSGQVDGYAAKHNPFVWFHSIIDDVTNCQAHVVSLNQLGPDLQRIDSTPNFAFISPGMADDGHDIVDTTTRFTDGWLHHYIPMIMASPAFRQDGLIVITYDEALTGAGFVGANDTQTSCCGEIPGPNSPSPGIGGPGGGKVSAALISPYIAPAVPTTTNSYNHYSALASYEDLLGITTGGTDGHGHLGFAAGNGTPNPGGFRAFGCDDIFTVICPPMARDVPAPPPVDSSPDVGPRPADGSTRWLNPGPQGNDLNGISCGSDSHCVAVGNAGSIVSTADGASWDERVSGVSANLNGVSCQPGGQACVAVGDAGTVLKSGDGGAGWSIKPSQTDRDLTSVSCPTPSRCYAVGRGGLVSASQDGGESWSTQTSGTTFDLDQITCPNATTCYVSGDVRLSAPAAGSSQPTQTPTVLSTTDGGATWVRSDANSGQQGRLRGIACVDATHCIAGSERSDFAYTTTGGGANTWSASSQAPFVNPARLRGLSCLGSGDCVAVGEAGVTATSGNAGATWHMANDEDFDELNSVSCPSAGACFAVGQKGTIVKSADKGASWTAVSVDPAASNLQVAVSAVGNGGGQAVGSVDLAGVNCGTAESCVAVGKQGLAVASADAGLSWHDHAGSLKRPPYNPGGAVSFYPAPIPVSADSTGLRAVSCASATSCVAVGDQVVDDLSHPAGKIATTKDGGVTWSGATAPTDKALTAVACPGVLVCFAVGDYGTVLKSIDAGLTWTSQPSDTKSFLNGISCPDASTCVAVGSFGAVLRTTDGGSHWTSEDSGTTSYLAAVSCPSTNLCIAVGSGGTALRIAGAGVPSSKSAGVGDDLMGVSCASHTHCVATGSFGTVISSANGGNDWTVQGTGTSRALRGVTCPVVDRCLATGDSGAILAVTPTARPGNSDGGAPPPGGGSDSGLLGSVLHQVSCRAQALKSEIRSGGLRLTRRSVRVSGRSRVRNCGPDGVKRVQLAIERVVNRGRCQFLGSNGRLGRARSCNRRVFQLARVRYVASRRLTEWTFRRRVVVPPGRYRIEVRGQDRAGRLESRWVRRAVSVSR